MQPCLLTCNSKHSSLRGVSQITLSNFCLSFSSFLQFECISQFTSFLLPLSFTQVNVLGAHTLHVCHKNSKFVHLSYLETSFNFVISTAMSSLSLSFSLSGSHLLSSVVSALMLFGLKWGLFHTQLHKVSSIQSIQIEGERERERERNRQQNLSKHRSRERETKVVFLLSSLLALVICVKSS